MSHLYWLDHKHLKRIQHTFPKPRGVARADDRKVLSGIIHVIRNGLRWRDAPPDYGPHKTLYNRWARWSRMGVFASILTELASEGDATNTLMIDATRPRALIHLNRRFATGNALPEPQKASLEDLCEDEFRLAGFGYLGPEGPPTIPLSNPSVPLIS